MAIKKLKWKRAKTKTWSFIFGDEPEAMHVIKTFGTSVRGDIYVVVFDDGYEMRTGETEISTKEEIEKKYNIKLR